MQETRQQPESGRSARKRRAILEAATEVFLHNGYLGTNMDEIAARSEVSKQTIYKQFGSKEDLFIAIVSSMTDATGDNVHAGVPEPGPDEDPGVYLRAYLLRQLEIVLDPRVMQLRRLVIGEVARFPELAKVLYERGPARAIGELATVIERFASLGCLRVDDPHLAATHLNWLVMSAPINQAMLLGDGAIPDQIELRRTADEGVRVFLAAYGKAPA